MTKTFYPTFLFSLIVFVGCSSQNRNSSEEQGQIIENQEATKEDREPMSYADVSELIEKNLSKEFAEDKSGIKGKYLFGDGSKAGSNITAVLDKGNNELVINTIYKDKDGKVGAGKGDTLNHQNNKPGVKIRLYYTDPGVTDIESFEIESGVDYPTDLTDFHVVPVNINNANEAFDMKIVSGGGNTGGSPAIVGADDAREYTKAGRVVNGPSGDCVHAITDWKNGKEIYLFYRKSGGNHQLVMLTKGKKPSAQPNLCFWKYGQNYWGQKFGAVKTGCP